MGTWIGNTRWIRPAAGILTVGALSVIPVLTGCAETANAADAKLERFTSCADLSKYAQEKALELASSETRNRVTALPSVQEDAGGAAPATPTSSGDAGLAAKTAGQDFSTTNVQEAGIDEPDIVKTDGNRIFAIAKNRLYAVDVSGTTPRIAGSLAMPKDASPSALLLSGNRLIVMAAGPVAVRTPLPTAGAEVAGDEPTGKIAPGNSTYVGPAGGSVFLQVDVADPAAMAITETFETEANYVSARLAGTTARIVVNSGAPFAIPFASAEGEDDVARTAAANRAALRRTTADNWVPRYSHRGADGRTSSGALVSCEAVSRPETFAGLGTLTVLTIDVTQGLRPIDTDAVMSAGETVYASNEALYIATNRWPTYDASGRQEGTQTTEIHKFDTSDGAQTTYTGSGAVQGNLLNQFSMSEHEGNLRIATTDSAQTLVGGDAIVPDEGRESESYVSVLEQNGDKLTLAGRVSGLGKTEQIQSVRFIGARGYVVTFRRTDPLYAIDLSDPRNPRVTGELKINGYSAYLHPIDENTLIGVGQDATDEGQTTGTQVAVFDVSDPAAPKRLHQYTLPGAYSEAEWDQYAFLYWPATSLAVLPIQTNNFVAASPVEPSQPLVQTQSFALGLRVNRDGIQEMGRITQPGDPNYGPGIRRSVVVGDSLLTLSETGIKASALGDLTERAWVPFP